MVDSVHTEGTTVVIDGDADVKARGFQTAAGTSSACERVDDKLRKSERRMRDASIHGEWLRIS
jgi:hypothetical protein